MKRQSTLFALALLFFFACGCKQPPAPGAPGATPTPVENAFSTAVPEAAATPAPTPTIRPVIAIYAPESAAAFRAGTALYAGDAAVVDAPEPLDGLEFSGRGALVAYLPPEGDPAPLLAVASRGVPVFVYAPAADSLPAGLFHLGYDPAGAAECALEEALLYPPHDTPVRLLGLFQSRESGAFLAWQDAVAAGKVLVKSVFVTGETENPVAEWMQKKLAAYYPGMLDGVYAETPALALAASDALLAAGRTDLEVFAAACDEAVLLCMQESPGTLPVAAGANPYAAGRLLTELAAGYTPGSAVALEKLKPARFLAATLGEDVAALAKME